MDLIDEHREFCEHPAALGPNVLRELESWLNAPRANVTGSDPKRLSARSSVTYRSCSMADTDATVRRRLLRAIRDLGRYQPLGHLRGSFSAGSFGST